MMKVTKFYRLYNFTSYWVIRYLQCREWGMAPQKTHCDPYILHFYPMQSLCLIIYIIVTIYNYFALRIASKNNGCTIYIVSMFSIIWLMCTLTIYSQLALFWNSNLLMSLMLPFLIMLIISGSKWTIRSCFFWSRL